MCRVTAEGMTCSINTWAPSGPWAPLASQQHLNKKWKSRAATDAHSTVNNLMWGPSTSKNSQMQFCKMKYEICISCKAFALLSAFVQAYLWLRHGSPISWSHRGPIQPGWHSQTTLVFSRDRQIPCLQMLQDLQPGRTPSDCCGKSLKSCSSLLILTSWMHPWKPFGVLSAPWRRDDNPVEVGIPSDKSKRGRFTYTYNDNIKIIIAKASFVTAP